MAKYKVQGCFTLEVEAEDYIDARETAIRILHNDGISYQIIDVQRGENDEPGEDSISGTEKAG